MRMWRFLFFILSSKLRIACTRRRNIERKICYDALMDPSEEFTIYEMRVRAHKRAPNECRRIKYAHSWIHDVYAIVVIDGKR